jgi:hypothetical protein
MKFSKDAKLIGMHMGLLEDDGEGESEMEFITPAENIKNRTNVTENWNLGPEKTSVQPDANSDYWGMMADLWEVDEEEARNRFCANCEYFNNTSSMQEQMKSIPLDKYDMDGGGRGYCTKFDFVCHNLRTCQAWEEKPFKEEEDMEE